jgi:hypothetical protein
VKRSLSPEEKKPFQKEEISSDKKNIPKKPKGKMSLFYLLK